MSISTSSPQFVSMVVILFCIVTEKILVFVKCQDMKSSIIPLANGVFRIG
jgi:hypothetical protein